MHASLDYQVFLTRNSEYHLDSHVCVGVRDRRTGAWIKQHPALHRPLTTTVRTAAGALAVLLRPQLGESLEFELDGAPLRTSPVLNIEQPKPWQCAANANALQPRRRASTDSDLAR